MFRQRHSYCLSPLGLLSQMPQIVWLINKRCFLLTVLGLGSPGSWWQQILVKDFWSMDGRPIAVFSRGGRPQLLIPS